MLAHATYSLDNLGFAFLRVRILKGLHSGRGLLVRTAHRQSYQEFKGFEESGADLENWILPSRHW